MKTKAVLRRSVRVLANVAMDARAGFTGAVRPALAIAGLVLFTAAALTVAFGLGLFVGGVCCIFLEFLLTDDDAPGAANTKEKRS